MIDINTIKEQAELSKKLLNDVKNQNRIFEQLIDNAMKGAPEKDKPEINKVKMLAKKAIDLAKQGKAEEAQTLINQFRHGDQGS